jgi:hypothetical protein
MYYNIVLSIICILPPPPLEPNFMSDGFTHYKGETVLLLHQFTCSYLIKYCNFLNFWQDSLSF